MKPYYQDESVTLYHGDCLEIDAWLDADVLVTDPPYGMRYVSGWDSSERIVHNDEALTVRDAVVKRWDMKPAAIFGTWKQPRPAATRHLVIWDKSDGTGCGMGDLDAAWGNTHEEIYILGDWRRDGRRRQSSVIRGATGMRTLSGQVGHPTPKPVPLMERVIAHAPPGVIADPFAGSGSTLIAARNLGRKAIGCEIDERYCELTVKRLAQQCFDFTEETA